MALSKRNKGMAFALVAASLALGACTSPEYTNNWDSVSAKAGNATYANTAIQEDTAFPRNVDDQTTSVGG